MSITLKTVNQHQRKFKGVQMENINHLFSVLGKGIGSYTFMALALLTVSDLILGSVRAFVQKKVNSSIAKAGLLRNAMLIVIPALLYPMAVVMNYGAVAEAFMGFLVLSQIYSVVENWVGLGLPFNDKWQSFFDAKKIEQKKRIGSIHTDLITPDEVEKRL